MNWREEKERDAIPSQQHRTGHRTEHTRKAKESGSIQKQTTTLSSSLKIYIVLNFAESNVSGHVRL